MKGYSLEAVKGAIAQSTAKEILTKGTIKEILAQQGLQGEILETTADELANAVSTNAVATAQKGATKSTHSLSLAFEGLGSKIKGSIKNLGSAASQLTTLPVGLMAVVAAIGVCVGGFAIAVTQMDKKAHKYLNAQQNIIDKSNELIESHSEEIAKLNELQEKLNNVIYNGENIVEIYGDLRKEIGDIPGLLNGQSAALETANAKLKDRIELSKEELKVEENRKKQALQDKYWDNVITNKGGIDPSLYFVRSRQFHTTSKDELLNFLRERDVTEEEIAELMIKYYYPSLNEDGGISVGELYDSILLSTKQSIDPGELYSFLFKNITGGIQWHVSPSEFNDFFDEQINTIWEYVKDTVDSYEGGFFTNGAIQDLITIWAGRGATPAIIDARLKSLFNNTPKLHEAIDLFYESLSNPDIDTDIAFENIKTQFSELISNYPELKNFVDRYYQKLFNRKEKDIDIPLPAISDIFAFKNSDESLTLLGKLSEELDSIQNAYKTLSDAMSEYQTNGSYSVDTLQSIMELGDDWLKYIDAETGAITLDKEALQDLAYAKTQAMKKEMLSTLYSNIAALTEEAKVTELLSSNNYKLADSTETARESAIANAKALLSSGEIDSDQYDRLIEYIETAEEKIKVLTDNASFNNTPLANIMSDAKNTADLLQRIENDLADSGEITFSTLQSISSRFPKLESYVGNYIGGIEGSEYALVEALKSCYQEDVDNYLSSYSQKMQADSSYWNSFVIFLGNQVDEYQRIYKIDLNNFKTYQELKTTLEKKQTNKRTLNELEELRKTRISSGINSASDAKELAEINEQIAAAKLLEEVQEHWEDYSKNSADIFTDKSTSSSPETFDWIETAIDRLNTRLDSLKSKADDVYSSWGSRTKSLDTAIQTTTEAIDLQGKAYDRYMQEADSVGLSETQAKLVRDGKIDIDDISDEKINEYQNWYNKAQDCLKSQDELKNSLNELNRQKFDGIQSRYEDLNSTLEHASETSQAQIDLAEARGLFANFSYYKEMIALTKSEISNLEKEKKELTKIQDNVSYGTEAWYDMQDAINGIDRQIQESETSIVEFNNSIRGLNWEIFEYLEESLNRITDEADFFIDLMSKGKLFDDKGFMTGYADASMALHAANYDVYRQQAQDYYKEVQTLEKQLAKGAGKEVLEQYNSMVDAHRNAVNAAEDEKQAILDLMEDGYNAQLDALDKLIEKKKDALSAEKELYSYQKSIDEKTSNISSLEKQLNAYKDDDSEDAMTRIQKLKVELEEAKTDLEETEYEKYLSDTETMLAQLSTDYEAWINKRLANEDALLADVVGSLQEKGTEITATLNEVADKYGTHLSDNLTTIFDTSSPFTTSLTGGMDMIANKVDGVTVAINNLINKVSEIVNVNAMATNAGSNNGNKNSSGDASVSSVSSSGETLNSNDSSAGNSSTSSNISNTTNNTSKSTQGDGIPKVGDKVKFISGQYFETEYGTGNTGNECLGQEVYITKIADNGTKRYHIGRTSRHGQHNLGWVNLNQLKGYKHGTKNADDEWAWTQEEGSEILYRKSDGAMLTPMGKGDMVWDDESSERLWEIANNPNLYNKLIPELKVPQLNAVYPDSFEKVMPVNSTANIEVGDISISLPNVTNYTDFRNALVKDGNFEKSVLTIVNNAVVGKSTIGKLRFSK